MNWMKGLIGKQWVAAHNDRKAFNAAQSMINAVARGDRQAAEMFAAGLELPFRSRNMGAVRYALELIDRRVFKDANDPTRSDADIGGCYRTLSDDAYVPDPAFEARYADLLEKISE